MNIHFLHFIKQKLGPISGPILGDSPSSHSRSYQLPMLMPCRLQAAAGGQNVIGGLLTLTVSWLVLGLSVYPVLENKVY